LILSKNKELVQGIITTLGQNGYKAYIVGGAVRDMLLNQVPKDVDILTNAQPRAVEALFAKTKRVGKAFSICLVNGVEVASCRAGEDADRFPGADLGMRDFTINSMAWDPVSDTLVDPFYGKKDLRKKIIRFTRDPGRRILEDPLRMIRACRFVARPGWILSDSSLQTILTHAPLINSNGNVAVERISMELIKAMKLENPSLFFMSLHETGLLKRVLPCLDRCFDLDGGPHHGETVFEHSMLVGDALPATRPLLRFAGFLHDAGKFDAAQIKDGSLTFSGHETHIEAIQADLENLRFSSQDQEYILSLVRVHMRPLVENTTPKAVRRLLAMLNSYDLSFRDFLRMRIADKKGNLAKQPYTLSQISVRFKKIQEELSDRAAFNINDLDISGTDIIELLDLEPGPEIGRIKSMLFERVLEDPLLNTRPLLKQLIHSLKKQQ